MASDDYSDNRSSDNGYGARSSFRGGSDRNSDRNGGAAARGGYFRAQPLELTLRRKKKADPFTEDPSQVIDYKDAKLLARFTSERGKILPRRMTGLDSANQRQIKRALKRAQHLGLMPYRAL